MLFRSDERFATTAGRLEHLNTIFAAMDEWASRMANAQAIEDAMAEHRLACGKLRSVAEVCATDWASEREATVNVPNRGDGTFRIPNAPWRFAGSDVRAGGVPKYRGEDNRAVLSELLGLDAAALDQLESQGVLTSRVPGGAR